MFSNCVKESLCFELMKGFPAALVALVIGSIAAGIAYRQYKTAKAKLKLDLFDRRYEIFEVTWTFLSTVSQGKLDLQMKFMPKLLNFIPISDFLFGHEISKYLKKIFEMHDEIFPLVNVLPGHELTENELTRKNELLRWFDNEARNGVKRKFSPYLDLANWN